MTTLFTYISRRMPMKKVGRRDVNEPDRIIATVAGFYGVEREDVCGAKRSYHIAIPRLVIMYLMRQRLGISYRRIGYMLGNRDHTTALNGVRRISSMITTNKQLRESVEYITRDLDQRAAVRPDAFSTS